jgi:signal transduction histidine kinase
MIWLMILTLATDLNGIRNEPNLERRSELALEYAHAAMDNARDAMLAGDVATTKAAVAEVGEAVELAYQSLADSGKDARHNTKYFKRAELKTRELMRRLEGLSQLMDVDDRPIAEKVRNRIAEIHDDLLQGIFSKKKTQ